MAETNRKPAVTVDLPAFKAAEVVGEKVKRIRELHPDFEVLVVDDGSTDSTMQAAMDAGANVWPHPYNMGNGAAVKSGLRAARGDYVVLMDADGQHDPADIARLLEYADRFDMVVGARTKASKTKAHRNLANSIYNRFASYVTKFKIEDLTSGFRVMRRATVEQYIYLLPNTFSYPSTITMAYLRSGRSVTYVPIETAKRLGKSKIKLVRDGIRFLLIITKIATLFAPLRIFMPVSFVFFLLGFGYYLFTYTTQGRFTNMSALLLNSAVIVFLIGLVSEQVTQLKYERTK
jgi:glycosyltransferase involved in cell wall biosynthesis